MTRQSNFRIVGYLQDGGDKVDIVVKAIDREKARADARTRGIRIAELIRVVKQHGRWKVLPDQTGSEIEIDDEPEPPPIIRDVAKPHTGRRPDRLGVALGAGEAIVMAMSHDKLGRIILFIAAVIVLVWLTTSPRSKPSDDLPPSETTESASIDLPPSEPNYDLQRQSDSAAIDSALARDRVDYVRKYIREQEHDASLYGWDTRNLRQLSLAIDKYEREPTDANWRALQRAADAYKEQHLQALASRRKKANATPLLYPESGSRDWSRNDYDAQGVGGYKIPTDPTLRRRYFEDMERENDRLEQELRRESRIP